ncbi:MAG TPA: dipeptidase [Ignavibacteriaceae bacterium]|nr:dipeptidase [Ignavibacteriaceae bacterium]
MKAILISFIVSVFILSLPETYSQSPSVEHYKLATKVLDSVPLVDGHNDLLLHYYYYKDLKGNLDEHDISKRTTGHTDISRLREGKVGAQFFTVFSMDKNAVTKTLMETIDCFYRIVDRYKDDFIFAKSSHDITTAFQNGKIAMLMNIEGGEEIENSLPLLRLYYELGVRYMTLTWNHTHDWADAGLDSTKHNGLNEFGKEVVREMNRLGMLVDISHVSDDVMRDVFEVSESPVIYSHSNARKFANTNRNVTDEILMKLKENNGIIMLSFVAFFVTQEYADWFAIYDSVYSSFKKENRETAREKIEEWKKISPAPTVIISDLADHFDHIKNLIGVDHIGIGSDFDGFSDTIENLDDCSKFPNLFAELARRGWTESELKKIAGENFLRVFKEAEIISKKLRAERSPSMMRID